MDSDSEQGVDLIGRLPDHIICHILSFLPTKYAVATSILSARWRYLWTSIPVLDFDDRLHWGFCPEININVDPQSEISFQNFLKILELRRITYLDEKCTEKLLSGCHVLEELVLEETIREKPMVVHISMPTLKRFSSSYRFVMDVMVDCLYKFIINAPKLEYFHVKGRISDDLVVKSLGSLINAHLDLRQTGVHANNYNKCCERVCDLFEGISNVNFLTLSNDVIQLLCATLDQNLPRFFNLTNLAFGIGFDFRWKRLVIEFIKCSPGLEVLTLNNKQGFLRDFDELQRSPPLPVPTYLLRDLKDILIEFLYANFMPEAVEFLPQDLQVLKRLRVNCQCPIMLRTQLGHNTYLANCEPSAWLLRY